MPNIGVPELLIVLVIVLVIFGASRLTDIMGALGKGVSEFRKGSDLGKQDVAATNAPSAAAPKVESVSSAAAPAPDQRQLATNLVALGNERSREGNVVDALKYLEQGRQVFHNLGDKQSEASALFSLATVYDSMLHDNEKTVQNLQAALALDPDNARYREMLEQKTKAAA